MLARSVRRAATVRLSQPRRFDAGDPTAFLAALQSSKAVDGATHQFYKYPARFSPDFAREAIRLFSRPGDLVLDPFMGGGTSGVEALAEGRRFCGNDINQLSLFVARVKTTLLSSEDEAHVLEWATALPGAINLSQSEPTDEDAAPYQKHLPWRLRKMLAQALATLLDLREGRQQDFARCSLLVAAQWALDCKSRIPSKEDFLEQHQTHLAKMLAGSEEFRLRVSEAFGPTKSLSSFRSLLCGDASKLNSKYGVLSMGRPNLVLTSPPYLGVHVLYHRWQILGRKETGAPYWIAGASDGHSGVFYTLADRRSGGRHKYLSRLSECFASVRKLVTNNTPIVQLVAFPDPDIDLPLYLSALEKSGLERCELAHVKDERTARERSVPNRKWYAQLAHQSQSSTEFLLIHRKKKGKS